jgi:hypothetical protein
MLSVKNNGSERETDHSHPSKWPGLERVDIYFSASEQRQAYQNTGTNKPAQAITLQTCIREAIGLNLDWDTSYLSFSWFSSVHP